jgi:hypothetical protein
MVNIEGKEVMRHRFDMGVGDEIGRIWRTRRRGQGEKRR